ncbi:hypothetical protein [Paraburkholderia ferrariae]|uniref:Uncharacterized protein n=1 Tax=Paraburkholderia ferrariae TaxID=386056 RepID=A0ABU9RUA5_9BURK
MLNRPIFDRAPRNSQINRQGLPGTGGLCEPFAGVRAGSHAIRASRTEVWPRANCKVQRASGRDDRGKERRCGPTQGRRRGTEAEPRKGQKPKTKNQKPKTKNQKPKTKNQKPKTKNQKQKPKTKTKTKN